MVTPPLPQHELRRLRQVARGDAHLAELIERRHQGEPLQYLEGTAPFGPLELIVDERVLIPRPETEELFERVVGFEQDPELIVDIGTGSGALALALDNHYPLAEVWATDVSQDALAVADLNRERLGLSVNFGYGDLFDAVPMRLRGRIDLMVSNPPYVAAPEVDSLPADVRREPKGALVAGERGTEVIERIGAEAARWLAPWGRLGVEIGETQEDIAGHFVDIDTEVGTDLTGRIRYVLGRSLIGDRAVRAVGAGEVIGVPTDTVYGIAVDPTDENAVGELFRLKARSAQKPIGILLADVQQALDLVELPPYARDLAETHWPGALTLVAPSRNPLPTGVGDPERDTLGVRVPEHLHFQKVLAETGPLAVTSANPSGGHDVVDDVEARTVFGEVVSVYVPGLSAHRAGSTVVDVTDNKPIVLREGPISIG
ncbi:MAG: peptide chain release factor N(5)-glutamine methyltransferase [Acidimicrobiia bacterium]|nr:peptide chain release factor N(5)-glutamine methyltransferase [Acidimicrobiia bacterium]